ncbi:hypothetical protein Bca52824_000436 [Brassica carinata]|uniref:Uncharacterized protein n=1 Tax=Brassica carinata TaxID=52824 RepID=A0A8X7WGJ4_BRACI|nr:hypothetical protein Bca52824_000436 [Brassica carinata]
MGEAGLRFMRLETGDPYIFGDCECLVPLHSEPAMCQAITIVFLYCLSAVNMECHVDFGHGFLLDILEEICLYSQRKLSICLLSVQMKLILSMLWFLKFAILLPWPKSSDSLTSVERENKLVNLINVIYVVWSALSFAVVLSIYVLQSSREKLARFVRETVVESSANVGESDKVE